MSIAESLILLNDTKTRIKEAIISKGVAVESADTFASYPDKIMQISGGGEETPAVMEPYVRPADWLALPTVAEGEEKFVGLYAVFSDRFNSLAFQAAGDYTVNWGDGNIENITANTAAFHVYDYAAISDSTISTRGYKQVVITITPQAGSHLTELALGAANPSGEQQKARHWLDISIASPQLEYLTMTPDSDSEAMLLYLEKFTMVGTNQITDFEDMLNGATALECAVVHAEKATTCDSLFCECRSLYDVTITTTNACTVFCSMFSDCFSLVVAPFFDTSSGDDFSFMLENCESLQVVPEYDTGIGTNFDGMFFRSPLISEVPDFNFSNATTLSNLFYECTSLKRGPEIVAPNAETLYCAFENCGNLIEVGSVYTPACTDFSYMFESCRALVSVGDIDTSSGEDFTEMFSLCFCLKGLPALSTANGTCFEKMFNNCYSLQTAPPLDISSGTDLNNMFYGCYLLKTASLINTSNVTNMTNLFSGCWSLLSVSAMTTGNCTKFTSMFFGCNSLKEIPTMDTSKAIDCNSMLNRCLSLRSIPAFNLNAVTSVYNLSGFANGCVNVTEFKATNIRVIIDLSDCSLSRDALVAVFNNLATVSGKTINIYGNWGASSLSAADKAIATSKGWTIST